MTTLSDKRIVRIMGATVAFLTVASVLGQISRFYFGHDHVHGLVELFDLDGEANIPTWYQSVTLLFAALLLLIIGRIEERHGHKGVLYWKGLSFIFLLMSIDEAASMHERIGALVHDKTHAGGLLYFSWVILGAPFVVMVGIAYWRFLWRLPRPTALRFLVAGIVYVGGALGVEALGGRWAETHGQNNPTFAAFATIEELMEMLGILQFVSSLLGYLRLIGGYIQIGERPAVATASEQKAVRDGR